MKYLAQIQQKPLNFLRNTRKCSLSSISPLLLILNSFFELLTLILLFNFDMLQFNDFIILLIFVSLLLLITVILLAYMKKKIENIYPFHNILLCFFLITLFYSRDTGISQNLSVNYFLGFLSAIFQIIMIQRSPIIVGGLSMLVSSLLYFFYFVKASKEPLIYVYYFLLFIYIILIKIEPNEENNDIHSKEHSSEMSISGETSDIMLKLIKNVFPGVFFLMSFEREKQQTQTQKIQIFEQKTLNDTNQHDNSPIKSFCVSSNLMYFNEGCKEYQLERKTDFIQLLDNFEISYIYKKQNLLEFKESQRQMSSSEKESELINEENKKRNLLILIKNRLESTMLQESSDNIILNGYINFKKIIKKPARLNLTTFENNGQTYLFFHFSDLIPEEDFANIKEISKFKDQMLANVAHDLRNPISGIIAFINQSLESNITKQDREKLLDYAKISANLLLHLVGDILDFSQVKKGVLNLVIKTFSLHEIVDQIFNMMRYQAEIKNVKLYLDYEPANDIMMETDDRRLCQLLINLLGNAIKFTVKGFVCLRISKTTYSNLLKFEVIDTGIGIKPEIMPHLFKPFSTFSDKSLNNKYGIGLGLSICKMIVSLLGPCDRVYVTSEYGKGAKFGCLLFTKIRKVDNSSLKLNINKIIWDKNDFKIVTNKVNMDILCQIPLAKVQGEVIEEERFNYTWQSPKLRLSELENSMSEKELDLNEKLDVSSYFSENEDFSIEEKQENHKEEQIIPENWNSVHKFQTKNPLTAKSKSRKNDTSENMEIFEGDMIVNDSKKQIKKVFSLNNLNESKIKLSEKNALNILIVDDNPFNIFILKNYLKKMTNLSFNVYSAVNGSQACEIFEEHNKAIGSNNTLKKIPQKRDTKPLQLIFMDCQMPIMNGYEATVVIKEKINKFGYEKALIVAITAYCDEKNCMERGMDAYLLKPVSEKDFLEIFENLFC